MREQQQRLSEAELDRQHDASAVQSRRQTLEAIGMACQRMTKHMDVVTRGTEQRLTRYVHVQAERHTHCAPQSPFMCTPHSWPRLPQP